jgi:hypothetical protein
MNTEQEIENATCGLAKMVYSKYQVDRYGLKEGKNKYSKFEAKKLAIQKDLLDFGIPCERLRIIKVLPMPFLTIEDLCTTSSATFPVIAFEYTQVIPALTWTIVHNLHFNPNVTIVDDNGFTIDAVVQYITSGISLKVTFSIPISGKAYLS